MAEIFIFLQFSGTLKFSIWKINFHWMKSRWGSPPMKMECNFRHNWISLELITIQFRFKNWQNYIILWIINFKQLAHCASIRDNTVSINRLISNSSHLWHQVGCYFMALAGSERGRMMFTYLQETTQLVHEHR